MNNPEEHLASIRRIMEQQTRFVSIAGLSGSLAGIYALVGAWYIQNHLLPSGNEWAIAGVLMVVLVLSLGTCAWMSAKKANKQGVPLINYTLSKMITALFSLLMLGGAVCAIFWWQEQYTLLSPFMLIFYGLSLISASKFTLRYIHTLGWLEVSLGLVALAVPEYGITLWIFGFGWLHLAYSIGVYWIYEK